MEYHTPVLLNESIDGLSIDPNGVYVDVTFGGGGHSREILKRLKKGTLVAFDQDKDAQRNIIDTKNFIFVNHNFRFLSNFLKFHQLEKVDGILADLGVSSHHFDAEDRGFSFRFEGDLDMRMNQSKTTKASDIINSYAIEDLYKMFKAYGELNNTGRLVQTIDVGRKSAKIKTIQEFVKLIEPVMPKHSEHKYLAKVFQALRIELNGEMNALKDFLEQVPEVLKPGGRLSVITYHSLEDRYVKNFIRSGNVDGKMAEKDFYGNADTPLKAVNRKIILPTEEEISRNNRARSAKLRIAERI